MKLLIFAAKLRKEYASNLNQTTFGQLDFWPISLCICSDGLTDPYLDGKHPKPISTINLVSPTRIITYRVKDVRRWEDTHFGQPLSYLSIELLLKR